MINFDRNRFNEMKTSEKIAFVNDLVTKNTLLTKEEMEYLSPENREKYLFNRVRTSEWLENYEFESLSDDEKEVYIWQKRYLQGIDIKKLTPELQREYISSSISSGVQLSKEEFYDLHSDELRRYYIEQKMNYSSPVALNSEEIGYLEFEKQIKYLNSLNRMGMAPNTSDFKYFKPETMRYYLTHKRVNEVRALVRAELRNILN